MNLATIESKDISVVVQGAISHTETPKCLNSIRKYLPDAEIILSTWENADVENLDYDILVLNKDPGAVLIKNVKNKLYFNNINRQLLSTQEGLKKATRKYILKFRSDLILSNDNFLKFYDKFPIRNDDYKIFTHKILTSCLFSRFKMITKQQINYIPFHISDWWLFGLKEDINKYFKDTPLVEEPKFTKYFDLEENKNKKTPYGKERFQFAPEQYFGYSCFSRNFEFIKMQDASDYNDLLMENFRKIYINNFISLEFEQSGIYLKKYSYSKNEKFFGEQYIGLYNFHRYESEYKKYCDSTYEITTHNPLIYDEKLGYPLLRIYKHIAKLINFDTPILSRLEQLFIGIPITVMGFLIAIINNKIGVKNVRRD